MSKDIITIIIVSESTPVGSGFPAGYVVSLSLIILPSPNGPFLLIPNIIVLC
jgi:hypothetical protein